MNTDKITNISGGVAAIGQVIKMFFPEFAMIADGATALGLALWAYFTNK